MLHDAKSLSKLRHFVLGAMEESNTEVPTSRLLVPSGRYVKFGKQAFRAPKLALSKANGLPTSSTVDDEKRALKSWMLRGTEGCRDGGGSGLTTPTAHLRC